MAKPGKSKGGGTPKHPRNAHKTNKDALRGHSERVTEQRQRAEQAEASAKGHKAALQKVLVTRKDGVKEHYNKKHFEAGLGQRGSSDQSRSRARRPQPVASSVDLPFNQDNPDAVLQRAAAMAAHIYANEPTIQGMAPKDRQAEAAKLAYAQLRLDATPKSRTGLNLEHTSTSDIQNLAFQGGPRKETKEEKEEREASQLKSLKQTERPGRYGSKPLTKKQIAKAQKAKTEPKKLTPGQPVEKGKLNPQDYLYSTTPGERDWITNQMDNPEGLFFGSKGNQVPGAYRKLQRYVNARQAGYEAPGNDKEHPTYQWLTTDLRGRKTTGGVNQRYKQYADKAVEDQYRKGIQKTGGTRPVNRYKGGAPSHEDFGVGIRMPGIPTMSQLEDQFPDLSDQQLVELHQAHMESADQFAMNQREAIESRHAQMLGKDPGDNKATRGDRVVFFTTSLGSPALSVGADSLLGQYIIKKRKKMLVDTRQKTRAQVKGEYPAAVRDQHVVELATGISVGAQGRYGAFRHVGYRAGSKKSKGYGKMLPVGSQILRDSQGQPVYDRNGNVRYTEGFSRPFDLRPSNDVGLRIYLG